MAAFALAALLAFAQPAGAQDGCAQPGKNVQCTDFGSIAMDSQRDIRGQAIDLSAAITLNTAYADHAARWLLFSVRNATDDGLDPVTVSLTRFSTPSGDVATTRVEQPGANELNLWVDVLDVPIGTPIALGLQVGAAERGAYRLEVLVMAFDRAYAPLKDAAGNDASLFSSTLLGVNKPSSEMAAEGGSFLTVPGLGAVPALAALAVAAAALTRRRT